MQRVWPQTSGETKPFYAPAQENSVSESRDRPNSPFNNYESEPINEANVSSTDTDFWCVTKMNVLKLNYVWTINSFSCFHEEMSELKSSTFGSGTNDKLRWCLRINPKGLDDESKEYLSLYLLLVQCNRPDIRAKFKFSIFNSEREESKAMESQRAYRFVQGKDWGFKKFIRRDYLLDDSNGLLPDDKLTIFCEVSIVTDAVNLTGGSQISSVQLKVFNHSLNIHHSVILDPNQNTLTDDIGSLFADDQFCDFTFKVGTTEIKAHKCILSARSPVFKAMLTHRMSESCNDSVEITDLDEQTIKSMLHFIYTETVADLNHIAFKLLAAADKYELKRLKSLCEHSLCNSLSSQNVCEILVHSDLHSADQLKFQCIQYINQHATIVMSTEGWNLISRDLIEDLYKALQDSHLPAAQACSRKRKRNQLSNANNFNNVLLD